MSDRACVTERLKVVAKPDLYMRGRQPVKFRRARARRFESCHRHLLIEERGEYMTNTNLLKSKMAAVGDVDFVKCLAEVLDVSRTTASKKLAGENDFTSSEITTLTFKYELSSDDIRNIFIGAEKN